MRKNRSLARVDTKNPTGSRAETSSQAWDPLTLPYEIARKRGIPKTPQGWWTLGLTVMAILIAVVLWLRFH